ncbi:MAG: Ig-like domain-containing protein [Ferruginibacter sp.]
MINKVLAACLLLFGCYFFFTFLSSCAQISAPTGGSRDTIAPVLIKAEPANFTTNFTGNKIVLTFDEYINVENIQENVLVSPLQKTNPIINYNFKNVTIKFRDTLLPNTTYAINFGNALKDLNENNPFPNFTYTFSTGNRIDSLKFSGKVLLAETGIADSTLLAMLYVDLSDSAVLKKRPNYISKLNREGNFTFYNLPAGIFKLYALKDGDGGKTYNSKSETFAFLDTSITVAETNTDVTLYAYEEIRKPATGTTNRPVLQKRLSFITGLVAQKQDVMQPLQLTFNNPIKIFNNSKISLTDTNFIAKPATFTFDSTRRKLTVNTNWQQDFNYALIIQKEALQDSADNFLPRNDTLYFTTKKAEDYGAVELRFTNLSLSQKPLLQFVVNDVVQFSYPLKGNNLSVKMIQPGEYTIRILYDLNGNGIWDAGNYEKKLQPEKAITLPQKLSVRANWDNELDINLTP